MGSRSPAVTVVQPPPPQITQAPPPQPLPPQTVQETSRQLLQSQLEFNPQLAQQAFELYQRYGLPTAQLQTDIQRQLAPLLAQSEFGIAQQYTPLYRALYEQVFPTQTRGLEELAQQAFQRLQSPYSLTPEQQASVDAIRQRTREQVARNIRESANLGGTLYGGRREERETEALNRLEQLFSEEDINRMLQHRAQTLQELIAAQQVIFPQVQQPGAPGGFVPQFQGVTPSADALLQAAMQQAGNFVATPAVVGFGPSRFSQTSQLLGSLAGAGAQGIGAYYGARS